MAEKMTKADREVVAEDKKVKQETTHLKGLSPLARAEVVNEVVSKQAKRQVHGFTDFLREQSVIGVGIGLVLGIQVKAVVDTIMAEIVNPLTQIILPGKESLSSKTWTITFDGKTVEFGWGAVAYSIFTFVMVAVIVYAGYKILKLDKLAKKKEEPLVVADKKKGKK
jgi:large conductance mechanosensitive channel